MRIRLVVVLGLIVSTLAGAQDTLPLRDGQRVRVSTRSATTSSTGSVLALQGDTLFLRSDRDGEAHAILRGNLVSVDTSRGSRHIGPGPLGGAIIGLGVGLVGGNALGKLFADRDRARHQCPDGNCELIKLLTIPLGGLFGFAVGGVIGSQLDAERWNAVTLPLREAAGSGASRTSVIAVRRPVSWLSR